MKKRGAFLCALVMTVGLSAQDVFAGKPVDSDGDGYKSTSDCNDNDPTVWVLNSCGDCAVEPEGGCGGGGTGPHANITGTFATPAISRPNVLSVIAPKVLRRSTPCTV